MLHINILEQFRVCLTVHCSVLMANQRIAPNSFNCFIHKGAQPHTSGEVVILYIKKITYYNYVYLRNFVKCLF